MRFWILLLCFSCWLSPGWSQGEQEGFEEFEEATFEEQDEVYDYEYTPVFDLEAVQDEQLPARQFDQNKWEALREANDYSTEGKPQERKEKEARERPSSRINERFGGLIKIVLFAMLVVVVALFLFLLLRPRPKDRKLAKAKDLRTINLDNLEENLDRVDVDPFIAEAEAAGDYQLAVRLHFLASLKTLSEKGLLKWKKDKTNRVYLREMRTTQAYPAFSKLTLLFERIWYGNEAPDQNRYEQLRSDFIAFRQSLDALTPTESHAE